MRNSESLPSHPHTHAIDVPPLGLDVENLAKDFRRHLSNALGGYGNSRSTHDLYTALAITLRDRLIERWNRTQRAHEAADGKRVHYLSLEFLMGRALGNAMLNLGITDTDARR